MNHVYKEYDVVVIGGGVSGIVAATAAARQGVKTLIVEAEGYLGGNATFGIPFLGFLDVQRRQITSGIAEEVVNRLVENDGSMGIKYDPHHNSMALTEPGPMKLTAYEMCREAGVEFLLHAMPVKAEVENGRLKKILAMGKGYMVEIGAKMFIDATGDGDIGYMAGAEYEKGDEVQPPTVLFTIGGVDKDKYFDYLDEHPEDHADPVDFFRNEPSHILVALKGLYKRLREQGKCPVNMPALIMTASPKDPHTVHINGMRLSGTDASDLFEKSAAELEGLRQAKELIRMLRENVPGFENCYFVNAAPSLGVRETRRLLGKKYLTVDKAAASEVPKDTIALAGYMIDVHSSKDDKSTFVKLENPFGIPYQCLISKNIRSLMMCGRCISVDRQVLGSARVMATCMNLGEAAGIGAALAVKQGVEPENLDVQQVRAELRKSGNILSVM